MFEIEEYKTLRSEILGKIKAHNDMIQFVSTVTVAIFVFATYFPKAPFELFLLPIFIIFFVSLKISYTRISVSKIAAYIIVTYEKNKNNNIEWETINCNVSEKSKSKRENIIDAIFTNQECFVWNIICIGLYIYRFIENGKFIDLYNNPIFYFSIILILIEYYSTFYTNLVASKRSKWEKVWEKEKEKIK